MPERKPEQEKEVMEWIEAVMGEPLPKGEYEEVRKISELNCNDKTLQLFTLYLFYHFLKQVLKNGVVLCKLMNKISPGAIAKFKESGPAFLLMENVQSFLKAIKTYGVSDEEVL